MALLFALWDSEASPDQIGIVDKALVRDAAARRLYLQCLEMHLQFSKPATAPEKG
jgi:hypothetical protein